MSTEVTADTFRTNDAWLASLAIKGDGLMTAVHAGSVTAPTTNAAFPDYLRKDNSVAVEVGGRDEIGQFLANDGFERGESSFRHVVLESEDEVVDDAIAVLHNGGAYLDISATKLNELQSVTPCLNATESAQFYFLTMVPH